MSFTTFKDRIWSVFDGGTRRIAAAPKPIQDVGYGLITGVLNGAYYLPGAPLRAIASDLVAVLGSGTARQYHRDFSARFMLSLRRMEALRLGQTEKIDGLLQIPELDRLDALSGQGGIIMVMPHCHASVLVARGLAARYPTLLLVRETKNEARAEAQRSFYRKLGCDYLDVRRNNEVTVARTVLGALRQGKIVIGVVDRIRNAPRGGAEFSKSDDTVRTRTFGQSVGAVGWPARFAVKCRVPILPVTVEQTDAAMILHLGDAITGGDLVPTTQSWMTAIEALILRFPKDWLFVYDKHWARVLKTARG
ncbi:hypothetical protein [Pseudoruegeria sp. SK021]|uniref:LpxL/LpxP family acyltransferase n=1 Tax=Pseudoruegeria sp. SK021 TaxID=1933035 RepID=UPI000A24FB94|nr:hypothetical protein [Pseudoruegeria sp. SK021]OSP56571.1 hypothetical protein BV911_01000 [Pseudoruegeria sp. SK021]